MHKWKVTVKTYPEGEEILYFANRPMISTSTDLVRIAGLDYEEWFTVRSVNGIQVESVAEEGLLELFEQKDIERLVELGMKMAEKDNSEEALMGRIVLNSIRYYKVVREVAEEVEVEPTAEAGG